MFCWHKWNKWSDPSERIAESNCGKFRGLIQISICEKCNKQKWRWVR